MKTSLIMYLLWQVNLVLKSNFKRPLKNKDIYYLGMILALLLKVK